MKDKKEEVMDIGVGVSHPTEKCNDLLCPFHGTLPIRGQILTGTVVSNKLQNSIVVRRQYSRYIPKYERSEKRTSKYSAHCPPCITVKLGDRVKIAECRPLSKTISFVVIEKI